MSGLSKRIRPFNQCLGDTRLASQALGTIFDFLFSLVKGKASSDQLPLLLEYYQLPILALLSLHTSYIYILAYALYYVYAHQPAYESNK